MKRSTPALLLALALSSSAASCVALAGVGVGYIISREELANEEYEARVKDDVEHVWPTAREAFGILVDPRTEITSIQSPRRLKGVVEGADVTIDVEAFDIESTVIRVRAVEYGIAQGDIAQEVLDYVLDALAKNER